MDENQKQRQIKEKPSGNHTVSESDAEELERQEILLIEPELNNEITHHQTRTKLGDFSPPTLCIIHKVKYSIKKQPSTGWYMAVD